MRWQEMADNLYVSRSNKERLKYENDEEIIYDTYTQHIVDDQEIYESENRAYEQIPLHLVSITDKYGIE